MKFLPGQNDADKGHLLYYKLTAMANNYDLCVERYQNDIGKYCVIVESAPRNLIVPCKSVSAMEAYVRACNRNNQKVLSYGLISMSNPDKLIHEAFEAWSKNSKLTL